MDIVDITDEDAEFVENVRKTVRMSRRMAWVKLIVFVVQLGAVILISVMLTRFFKDELGIVSPRDLGLGLCLGFIFGTMIGITGLSAAKHFGEFMDGMWGNKQNRLLIKYFEIATGQKGARNLITAGRN